MVADVIARIELWFAGDIVDVDGQSVLVSNLRRT